MLRDENRPKRNKRGKKTKKAGERKEMEWNWKLEGLKDTILVWITSKRAAKEEE